MIDFCQEHTIAPQYILDLLAEADAQEQARCEASPARSPHPTQRIPVPTAAATDDFSSHPAAGSSSDAAPPPPVPTQAVPGVTLLPPPPPPLPPDDPGLTSSGTQGRRWGQHKRRGSGGAYVVDQVITDGDANVGVFAEMQDEIHPPSTGNSTSAGGVTLTARVDREQWRHQQNDLDEINRRQNEERRSPGRSGTWTHQGSYVKTDDGWRQRNAAPFNTFNMKTRNFRRDGRDSNVRLVPNNATDVVLRPRPSRARDDEDRGRCELKSVARTRNSSAPEGDRGRRDNNTACGVTIV